MAAYVPRFAFLGVVSIASVRQQHLVEFACANDTLEGIGVNATASPVVNARTGELVTGQLCRCSTGLINAYANNCVVVQ